MANDAPIIIKKVKKSGGHGHHGGAWKVAYADFVTAMMAFFLLMWLLNATTEDQRKGIADYFTPATASTSKSGAGGLLGGQSVSAPGAMASRTNAPSVSVRLKPTSGASDGDAEDDIGGDKQKDGSELSDEELQEEIEKREAEQFEKVEADIRQAIQEAPDLQGLEKHLVIDQTPEGLRIQIVDQEGRSMFPSGSSSMLGRTRTLLRKITAVIKKLPNKIALSGHTDATPFRGRVGFGNWELSSQRANASRRELIAGGLTTDRIEKVVGRADKELLVKDDPKSPRNRRISIVLLRQGATEKPSGPGKAASKKFKRDWTGPRLR